MCFKSCGPLRERRRELSSQAEEGKLRRDGGMHLSGHWWSSVLWPPLAPALCLHKTMCTEAFLDNYSSFHAVHIRCPLFPFMSLQLSMAESFLQSLYSPANYLITRGEILQLPLRGVIMEVINDRRAGYSFLQIKSSIRDRPPLQ